MSGGRSTGNDEDMVNCPYDIGHRMLRKRLQQHLMKCRRNHSSAEMVKCPLNKLHIIPEPEYEIHLRYCPDRKLIAQYRTEAPQQTDDDFSHAPIESGEPNWDDDDTGAAAAAVVVEEYNPREYAKSANIIRMPTALRPSERKEFVKRERERHSLFCKVKQEVASNESSLPSESEVKYKVFDPKYKSDNNKRNGYGASQTNSNDGRQASNRVGLNYGAAPSGSRSSGGEQEWINSGNREYTNKPNQNHGKYAPYNPRKKN